MIVISFENESDKWMDISEISATFGEEIDNNVVVVLGRKLDIWKQASNASRELDLKNFQLFMTAIGAVGVAGSLSSLSSNPRNYKDSLMYHSLTLGALSAIHHSDQKKDDLEKTIEIPDSHLMSNFIIPPGIFTHKWILFQTNSKTPILESFSLNFKLEVKKNPISCILEERLLLTGKILNINPKAQYLIRQKVICRLYD